MVHGPVASLKKAKRDTISLSLHMAAMMRRGELYFVMAILLYPPPFVVAALNKVGASDV